VRARRACRNIAPGRRPGEWSASAQGRQFALQHAVEQARPFRTGRALDVLAGAPAVLIAPVVPLVLRDEPDHVAGHAVGVVHLEEQPDPGDPHR
jgi:hypothetical protein